MLMLCNNYYYVTQVRVCRFDRRTRKGLWSVLFFFIVWNFDRFVAVNNLMDRHAYVMIALQGLILFGVDFGFRNFMANLRDFIFRAVTCFFFKDCSLEEFCYIWCYQGTPGNLNYYKLFHLFYISTSSAAQITGCLFII